MRKQEGNCHDQHDEHHSRFHKQEGHSGEKVDRGQHNFDEKEDDDYHRGVPISIAEEEHC